MKREDVGSALPPQVTRIAPNHRLSRAVVVGQMVHIGGQFANDLTGEIKQQTLETLAQLDSLLADCGTNRSGLVSATIWLRDMSDFKATNEVWDAWIDRENPPTRCCCQALMANPEMKIELTALAVVVDQSEARA